MTLSGGFEARSGSGEAIELHGRKNQALLAYLAVAPGEPRSRDKLIALLWSDRGEQQARASLRQALVELRRALDGLEPAPLVADRDAISLDADAIEVDVATFERAIAEGTPDAVGRAVELYRGDLLDGFATIDPAFEEWLRDERTRLNERAREAFSGLLDHQVSIGETEAAIATARRLLALDPLQEPVHRALMRLYAGKGDRALAIRQYQACGDVLKEELGLDPDAETEQLAADIRSGAVAAGEADEPATAGEPSTVEALPLPDRPSVAVLPFVNMSGDSEQAYFAEGITENIITGLTRFRELFVIAWHTSLVARDGAADVQQIGHRLGVAHIVEGSVRKAGNRVRVTAQLIDAASGHRVWAEHYDRDLDELFAVQDEIGNIIIATLAGRIDEAGRQRATQMPVKDMVSYDYVLRGRQCLNRGTKDGILEARRYFERALELDAQFATACASLAVSYIYEYESDWAEARPEARDHGYEFAQRAVALDHANSAAWHALAWVQLTRKQHELARIAIERAIALNPNDYHNLCTKGWCLALSGDLAESIACLNQAMRLNPFAPVDCILAMGIAEYRARHYEAAIEQFGRITGSELRKNACLAACYGQLGRDGEARAAVAEALELARTELPTRPGAEVESMRRYLAANFHFQDPAGFEHLVDGLHRAGLPIARE
jgi:TolB-like protein/Tfp pilus assembly protein PilF